MMVAAQTSKTPTLRAEGQVIDDDILGLTTPLFRKHVNVWKVSLRSCTDAPD